MLRIRSQFMWLVAAAFAGSAIWPSAAYAQRRGRGPVVIVSRPFFAASYDPFFQYGYPWGYPWGYPYGYGYGYPYSRYDPTSDIRLIVTPKTADVYVDGNKVGVVDNFDGVFQSLNVLPGRHELVVYQEGYRAIHQAMDVRPGTSYKLQYTMVPLQNGEAMEPRPVPQPPPAADEPSGRGEPSPPYGPPPPRGGMRGGPPPAGARSDSSFGSVAIRVQPADATITIDGNAWQAPEGSDRLTVELSDGRHHVEISKSGFKKYSADIDVRRGQTTALNVSLLQSDGGA